MIRITNRISIPEEELSFTASLSSGPGGQNVNKLNTRVTLRFDLANSPSLSPEDKALIATRLGTRIAKDGMLRVVSQSTRSQHANRELAVERFAELLKSALKRAPVRKETRVSKAAKERRLEEKKLRSSVKRQRSKGNADNDRDM
ncbi:alternative ribosome rescue aminoacyl-tRNA hydrolase ArfB [Syntrophobacter fumaroxidans]|uniref:Class I peptide chain release factor n=1 Tax=Syntrophobacter fumaroxidans (strain DSM 10017 / MPOB) TaxID=335543 RepID=A0LKP1_SYNFM|nr:alternative ribosome rescue aminoacyl-tRNA hydrolase ArfB [Syntrophobacter fumaroxidans]ABK17993.1 Class I peptide chain release factor [Syntrophobacter fumaroxidans MPOB]